MVSNDEIKKRLEARRKGLNPDQEILKNKIKKAPSSSERQICQNCGTENSMDADFCINCGNKISKNLFSNEKKSDKTVNKVNWRDSCPVCKSSKLTPRVHKGVLGITTKNTLECDNCGAVFEEKGQKYKLSKVKSFNDPFWRKYMHQALTEAEWTRITNGGVSDAEQMILDKEKEERKKRELEALKERDINEFLTSLQNGTVNVTTDDPYLIILKKNEMPSIVMSDISLLELRSVRQTIGGRRGGTIRLGKGVSFRIRGTRGQSVSHEELTKIDQGTLVLTNKRLVFIGSIRTTNIDLRKIVAIEPYEDGIASQRENKQKTEYFIGTDKSSISFTKEGRSTTIPINGVVLKAAIQGNIARLG